MAIPARETACQPSYGPVARALHWLIFALLAVQYAVAWTMPEIHRGVQPEGLIGLHLSFGAAILFLAMLRLAWRLLHPVPLTVDACPAWQRGAASAIHALLYLLLLTVPLMGWGNASARGWAVQLFGGVRLPSLLPDGSPLGRELGDFHIYASYLLLGLAGIHVAAALYHHFWRRDRVLARMLSGIG